MAPVYTQTAILTGVIILVTLINAAAAVGPKCYECSRTPHPRDCRKVVTCGSHEECSTKMLITSDGITYYQSGCRARALCTAGKRADTAYCTECCKTDYCNEQLCDQQIALKKRCFSCEDVVRPSDCNLVVSCDQDQICFTEKILVNKEERYRLGCTRNITCDVGTSGTSLVLGKRQSLPNIPYCGECCGGSYCNRDLCSTGATSSSSIHLLIPPPDIFCSDYDSHACHTLKNQNPNFCRSHDVRNFLCRRACGVCSGGIVPLPGTTMAVSSTRPTTPTSPSATNAPACSDKPGTKCATDPEIKKLVCQYTPDECRKSCGLCSANSVTSATATTGLPHVCDDPIPKCQCVYLDREIDICHDPEVSDTFCCYYCKQKYNPGLYTCPSETCRKAEANEAHKVLGLNITCHDADFAPTG